MYQNCHIKYINYIRLFSSSYRFAFRHLLFLCTKQMAEADIFVSMESSAFLIIFWSPTLWFSGAIIDHNSSLSRYMFSIICHLTLNRCISSLRLPSEGTHTSLKTAINYSLEVRGCSSNLCLLCSGTSPCHAVRLQKEHT